MAEGQYGKLTFKSRKNGQTYEPLLVLPIERKYVILVYQGTISTHDLLVKYKQLKNDGRWTSLRTPQHIHWAVDMLTKRDEDKKTTEALLDAFIGMWTTTAPLRSEADRVAFLNESTFVAKGDEFSKCYASLSGKGEYSVKFLTILGMLLMTQEKTNLETAFMFGKVLDALRQGKDTFSVISAARYNGR